MENSLAARVRAATRAAPDAVALVHHDEEIRYGDLVRQADEIGRRLPALAPGVPVAVPATTSPGTIALLLALLSSGRPFLLIATGLPAPVRAALIARAGCGAVLTPEGAEPVTPGATATPPPAGTAMMLTTSGSTGQPKIVPLPGDGICRFVDWAVGRFGLGPGRTVLNYAPLNFDLCLLDVWATLASGGTVVPVDPGHATRAAYLHDLLLRHRVHVVQAVPMFYRLLADHPGPLTDVEHVIATGDVLPQRCLAELPRLFPRARHYNLYGCTETNDSFLHELTWPATAPVPLGEPVDGVHAVLVADGAVLTGPGTGELYVSTPFQAPGYLDTAAGAFGPHPAGADDRTYFRSGDLVRRHPDGTLTLEGRTDLLVKVRGVRVNPLEVERALLAHPSVTAAVVFALPDPVAGTALHAVVSHDGAPALNTLAVRAHCAELLPRAAIPAVIHLAGAPLPRTSTGKPDRARITSTYLERTR